MDSGSPPEGAYGRVTNLERFRPLHALADAVVAALLASYEIASVEHDLRSPHAALAVDRSTRVVPLGGGAPVTVWWTTFPGLLVQFGESWRRAFPGCGCDACDETAMSEARELLARLGDVADGGFQEWVEDGKRYHAMRDGSGWTLLDPAEDATEWRSEWKPWRRVSQW